jgi:hypothetical protein
VFSSIYSCIFTFSYIPYRHVFKCIPFRLFNSVIFLTFVYIHFFQTHLRLPFFRTGLRWQTLQQNLCMHCHADKSLDKFVTDTSSHIFHSNTSFDFSHMPLYAFLTFTYVNRYRCILYRFVFSCILFKHISATYCHDFLTYALFMDSFVTFISIHLRCVPYIFRCNSFRHTCSVSKKCSSGCV